MVGMKRWFGWSRAGHGGTIVNRELLNEIVRRIVAVADPEQIILFGSGARSQLRPDSDYDLLVVKSGDYDTREFARTIHAHLFGLPVPVDVIVATPEQLWEARNKLWTILGQAQLEGKRIYSPYGRRARQRRPSGFFRQAALW